MANKKVVGEQAWQLEQAHTFSVSPSNEAYKLYGSADGITYGEFGDVPANDVLIVSNSPRNMFFKFVGNNSELTITW